MTGAQMADDEGTRKPFETLRAELALRGYQLTEMACGGFLIHRWNLCCHQQDLTGVRAFLRTVDGQR